MDNPDFVTVLDLTEDCLEDLDSELNCLNNPMDQKKKVHIARAIWQIKKVREICVTEYFEK